MVASIQKSAQWLKDHYSRIGASEAATAVGLSPWQSRSQLGRIMLGLESPPDLSDNPDVLRGVLCESAAIAMLSRETGEQLVPHDQDGRILSDTFPWASCLPDALTSNTTPAEVKCVRRHTLKRMEREGIPMHYLIQLQHTMAVMEVDEALFGALNLEDMKLYHERVQRDDDLIESLMDAEEVFWSCIQDGIVPDDVEVDTFTPEPVAERIVITDHDAIQLAKEWLCLKETEKVTEQRLTEMKDELLARIGGHESFEFSGVLKGTHKQQKGRTSFDHKACCIAHPEMEQYYRIGAPFNVLRTNAVRK